MTRSVSRGISSNARTISASRRPVSVVVGTAAHMPCVELAAELLDEALLVLGDLDGRPRRSAARRDPGACAGTSSRPIMPEAPRPTAASGAPTSGARVGGRRRRPGPAPCAELAQAVADRLRRRSSRARAARPRAACSRARGGRRARSSACSPSRAPRRRGGARRGSARASSPSKKTSVDLVAVAAGDDDGVRAEARAARRASVLGVVASCVAGEHARLGQVRGDHGRAREQQLDERRAGRRRRAARRRTRRPSPGRSRPASPGSSRSSASSTARDGLRRAEHADLHRVDADVLGDRADLLDDELRPAPGGSPVTPTVFCAVSAVIAVIPWTPQRANAFRSAWMPAPPPESEPAIERTAGTRMALRVATSAAAGQAAVGERQRGSERGRVTAART